MKYTLHAHPLLELAKKVPAHHVIIDEETYRILRYMLDTNREFFNEFKRLGELPEIPSLRRNNSTPRAPAQPMPIAKEENNLLTDKSSGLFKSVVFNKDS